MQREGWILSTAARRITLAPHCVSRMFMPKKNCTIEVENPAGKLPPPRLHLVQHRSRQPARANHAIRLAGVPDQVQKRRRGRGAVGIHVPDQIGARRQAQTLDQRPALADGGGKFQRADFGKLGAHPPHHAERYRPGSR